MISLPIHKMFTHMPNIAIVSMLVSVGPALAEDYSGYSQQQCMDKAASMWGVFYVGHDFKSSAKVIIREDTWNTMTFEAKQNSAELLDCAIAGPGKAFPFEYVSHMTNKPIASWSGARLTVY